MVGEYLNPSTSEFVEECVIEGLVGIFAAHGEKDVAANELMDHLTVGGEALENNVLVIFKLDHHVPSLPVHIPSLHSGVSPSLDVVSSV